jgi:hypothetical protein
VKRLANAKVDPEVWKDGCDLTGAQSFAEALAALFASQNLCALVEAIIVSRSNLSARIFYRRPKRRVTDVTVFGPDPWREFDVICRVSGDMLRFVGNSLRESGDSTGERIE